MTAARGPLADFLAAVAAPALAGEPDAALLERFARGRDEAAFAELVRRHAGMVHAVARRAGLTDADADDCTQAAFVVLIRQADRLAGRLAPGVTAGDWLHGVAVRVALAARTRQRRRLAHESRAARPPAVPPDPGPDRADTAAAVDRAVRALPAKLRDAVVLCDLEGVTQPAAAARLGVPVGTVSSRLTLARRKLARRLGPAAVLAAALPGESAGAVEAVGRSSAGAVPAGVSALVTEVTRMLLFHKLKVALAGLAVAAGAAGAGVALTRPAAADDPKPPANAGTPPVVVIREPKRPAGPVAGTVGRASLDAEDIRDVTGLDVYKFQLTIPKGQKFHVALRRKGDHPSERQWNSPGVVHEQERDGPTTVRVSFLREDGRLAPFFLGDCKAAVYRVQCEGGASGGWVTTVGQPLADLPGRRLVYSIPPRAAPNPLKTGVTLVKVMALDENGKQTWDRWAEVVVEPVE